MNLLNTSSLRYLLKHPWQMLLSIIGIAIGVSVVVAIDLANQSATRAFEMAMESVGGKATHRISGSTDLPDTLYRDIRIKTGFRNAAPVIEQYVIFEKNGDRRTLMVLGVDPLAEAPFRPYVQDLGITGGNNLGQFMTQRGAAILFRDTAEQLQLAPGDTFTVAYGGVPAQLHLIGVLDAADEYNRQKLEGLAIVDIATAQEIFGMNGQLSHIDLLLPDSPEATQILADIKQFLPSGVRIQPAGARSDIMAQMTRAFNINLTALSLLAVIVGMFLIYNTMTFSVVQRLELIGLLRTVGVTRREIFTQILGEAFFLGLIGTILGLLLGVMLGSGLLKLVTQTINDLYFVVTVRTLALTPFIFLKGLLLGIGATLLAAFKPAREATAVAPRTAMQRSGQETQLRSQLPQLTVAGLISVVLGVIILLLPSRNIPLSYSGILLLIIGFTLWTPLVLLLLMRVFQSPAGKLFGLIGRKSARDVVAHLSRTGVAIAALSMAVAATVGVGTMVGSFRATVVHWLENQLRADVYISRPSLTTRNIDATLPAEFLQKVQALPGVREVNAFRSLTISEGDTQTKVIGTLLSREMFFRQQFKAGNPQEIWAQFADSAIVMVSEPFAYRNRVSVGDALTLPTANGDVTFRVAGIYFNYASEQGFVLMSLQNFRKYWRDDRISGVSAFAAEGIDSGELISDIRALAPPGEELLVRSNRDLRETSIEIFDRTFLVTNVLRLLAIVVAFIGVLSALMALQLERRRELGILRANGFTPREVWRMITLQTGLMGLAAGILSLPMGLMLSYVLIYVINQRSFGWTLQFQFIPEIFLQAVVLAIVAALLAGLYPAFKMAKTSPALALREE